MKKIIVSSFCCLFTLISFSQLKLFPLKKEKKEYKILLNESIKMPPYLKNFPEVPFNDLKLKKDEYNVIILPLDNMPCYVPNINLVAKMPVQKNGCSNSIPNSMSKSW